MLDVCIDYFLCWISVTTIFGVWCLCRPFLALDVNVDHVLVSVSTMFGVGCQCIPCLVLDVSDDHVLRWMSATTSEAIQIRCLAHGHSIFKQPNINIINR